MLYDFYQSLLLCDWFRPHSQEIPIPTWLISCRFTMTTKLGPNRGNFQFILQMFVSFLESFLVNKRKEILRFHNLFESRKKIQILPITNMKQNLHFLTGLRFRDKTRKIRQGLQSSLTTLLRLLVLGLLSFTRIGVASFLPLTLRKRRGKKTIHFNLLY